MFLIAMQLIGPAGVPVSSDDLRRLLAAAPVGRVEHIWVQTHSGLIDLVFFVLAECEAEAFLSVRATCLRAIESTFWLVDWRLCDTVPPAKDHGT